MDNTPLLLFGLLFGSVGIGYFIYGKRKRNAVIRYTGVALMVFPYFLEDTLTLVIVGAVLLLLPRLARNWL